MSRYTPSSAPDPQEPSAAPPARWTPLRSATWLSALALAAAGTTAQAAAPSIEGPQALATEFDAILADPALVGLRTGVLVRDLETGQDLYTRDAAEPMNPASGSKLLTAAAALAALGPATVFQTELRGPAPEGSVLPGDLCLHGGGDPYFLERDLWELVRGLEERGLHELRGDLILDASRYDDRVWPPAYDQKPSDAAYQAPVAALALGFTSLELRVTPGTAVGEPARLTVAPLGAPVVIDNTATTVRGRGARLSVTVVQAAGGDRVSLRGRIGLAQGERVYRRRATRPVRLVAGVLERLLERAGLRLTGQIRYDLCPPAARVLAQHDSPPLRELVALMNKHSNNFMAEMLVKELAAAAGGKPASSARGVAELRRILEARQLWGRRMRVSNGSGLYDANRVTAQDMVGLLQDMAADPELGPEFLASLAVAGRDGSLRHRFDEPGARAGLQKVRAKSGTLARVSTLTGYAVADDGHRLAFSFLFEEVESLPAATRALDRMAAALVRYHGN